MKVTEQHKQTLEQIRDLILVASLNGTLDEVAANSHPDIVNEFCDTIARMLYPLTTEKYGLELTR